MRHNELLGLEYDPSELRIFYLPLALCARVQDNPKLHDLGKLAEAIARHGFKDPPKWEPSLNGGQGGIVEGNGRIEVLQAMKAAGEDRPRGIKIQIEGPEGEELIIDWLVPVIFGVDAASEAQALAYLVDHNNVGLFGGDFTAVDMAGLYDRESYLALLEGVAAEDCLPVSVDGDDLDLILSLGQEQAPPPPPAAENEADVDKLMKDAAEGRIALRANAGEIWALGRHRLIVGDSTSREDMGLLMAGKKARMVWTDPPYNVNYSPENRGNKGSINFSKARKANPLGKIANDNMAEDEFRAFIDEAFSRIEESLEPGSAIYISHADSFGHHFRCAFVAQPWKLQTCLIWNKINFSFGHSDYHWQHEPILYGWKEGAPHRYYGDRKQTTIIEFTVPHYDRANCDTEGYVHPTQKPTPLIEYCLNNSSQPGDIVLDLFGGSGSTLIACERTGRTAYLSEIDPKFATVIIERFERFTGEVAKLLQENA